MDWLILAAAVYLSLSVMICRRYIISKPAKFRTMRWLPFSFFVVGGLLFTGLLWVYFAAMALWQEVRGRG